MRVEVPHELIMTSGRASRSAALHRDRLLPLVPGALECEARRDCNRCWLVGSITTSSTVCGQGDQTTRRACHAIDTVKAFGFSPLLKLGRVLDSSAPGSPAGERVGVWCKLSEVTWPAQDLFDDLLTGLTPRRQVHSRAVGRKAASLAMLVQAHLRVDLVIAATLHDIGYGHPTSGFHPVDGARFLVDQGFSKVVCHLVAHHSASSLEAEERGLDVDIFREFDISGDATNSAGIERAHAVLWWADLTTSPDGADVDVRDRLNEICSRYGPNDPVTRFVKNSHSILIDAGQLPIGSIQVPVSSIAH